MADSFTTFQARLADVHELDNLLGTSIKKADRLGILIDGFKRLGPRQRLDAMRRAKESTNADQPQRALAS